MFLVFVVFKGKYLVIMRDIDLGFKGEVLVRDVNLGEYIDINCIFCNG